MSTKWYPFIVESKCTGCIACVEFCEYGVLEEIDSKAHVMSKDNCIEGCKDCQKYCITKAIYFPDELEEMIKDGIIKCSCGEHE
ncbi:putative 4Fe-4S ferredoxin [Candidatus Desulfosporosinus infrequens]|uniref:Putative 4Fe-4S ferredoxin n=1 Tax=Candidatus Desulfosporosinus infrequens TaxID=2043169 RepID=A0A2U3LAW4_9FIRM|nr:putative 4Fe-4S ferredoxin [Candidatus Desulfosporosinus infrequens]